MNKDQAISEFNLLMDQYVLIINKLTDLNGITKDLYEHLLDALDFKIVEVK